jgi:hypothetical protein
MNGGSVLITFDLLCSSAISVQDVLIKNDNDSTLWDLSVYLNGSLIKSMASGQSSDVIVWDFKEGRNNISITIDAAPKITSSSDGGLHGELVLMQKSLISNYGIIYQNYLNYLNNQIYKNKNQIINNSFSIDTIASEKFLISDKNITHGSRLYYYSINSNNSIDSIRLRADLVRSNLDYTSGPVLISYRLKFKNSKDVKDSGPRLTLDRLTGR